MIQDSNLDFELTTGYESLRGYSEANVGWLSAQSLVIGHRYRDAV